MANEIIITVPVTSWTISAVLVRRTDGATWNVNTSSWDATQTAARANYRILLAQSGSYNMFTASMPVVAAGLYRVAYYREVGSNYLPVAEDILQWDETTVVNLDLTQTLTLTTGATVGGALSSALTRFLKQEVVGVPGQSGSSLKIYKSDGTTLLATIDLSTVNQAIP